jgi:tripartite-type tricarboxylate transporter receptor subunit TctC
MRSLFRRGRHPIEVDMSVRRHEARLVLGVLLAVTGGPARAQTTPDPFYAGKTLSIIVDGGGAYETYARMLAQHLPKYIPGRPAVIVQEMPGAGGVRAANFLYNIAPRDGTVIAGLHGAVLTAPLLNPNAATFDVTRFSWIGNVTRDTYVGYVWHTSPVQALEEAKSKQLVLGGTSVGGNGIDMAIVARDVFGFRIKIVSGYKTSAETKIALERGEIDGTIANLWTSLKQTDWLAKGLVRVIVQHGTQKHPELPSTPLFRDFARNDAERQMLDVLGVREEITRPYLAPSEIPAERLTTLRRAFDATLRDPAYRADMQRQQLEVEGPSTGEELAVVVDQIAKTPPAVVQRLVTLFNNYKDAR